MLNDNMTSNATTTASCCSQFYEQDWVQTILGESFHPGGMGLSRRLLDSLNIKAGDRVLDVACGMGTSVQVIAKDYSGLATGLDFSQLNINRAVEQAAHLPVSPEYLQGSAASLPFPDGLFDHLICECAVSTFDKQQQVVKEFFRVLNKGGQVGISDMVLNGMLPTELHELIVPWTCLESAKTAQAYQRLFIDAGFTVVSYKDESQSLLDLIADLKRRLLMAGLGKMLSTIDEVPHVLASLDIKQMKSLLDQVKQLVNDGTIQYCRMVFVKEQPAHGL